MDSVLNNLYVGWAFSVLCSLFLAAIAALWLTMSFCWLVVPSVSTSFNENEMLKRECNDYVLVLFALSVYHILNAVYYEMLRIKNNDIEC